MALYQAVQFKNPTDTDFIGVWDGEPYEIKAGGTISVPKHIAEHFAKHLINRILQQDAHALCKKHPVMTQDNVQACKDCKVRDAKLKSIYTDPRREELYAQMLVGEKELLEKAPESV